MLVWESARKAARAYQKAVGGEVGAEVDPFELAQALEMRVSIERLKPQYSGFISQQHGKRPEVLIQETDPYVRQRFTLAHEIGHYVERMTLAGDNDFSFSDLRSSEKYDLHEFYADEFAGELLMPCAPFVEAWKKNPSFDAIARRFRVSPMAAEKRVRRLCKTGDLSDET